MGVAVGLLLTDVVACDAGNATDVLVGSTLGNVEMDVTLDGNIMVIVNILLDDGSSIVGDTLDCVGVDSCVMVIDDGDGDDGTVVDNGDIVMDDGDTIIDDGNSVVDNDDTTGDTVVDNSDTDGDDDIVRDDGGAIRDDDDTVIDNIDVDDVLCNTVDDIGNGILGSGVIVNIVCSLGDAVINTLGSVVVTAT